MADKMKLTRQNFIDYVFQPYNAAVKRDEYNKIKYEDWRKIRGWAYDETWSTHDMEIKEQCGDYFVGLWHNLRVCPVPLYFSAEDGALGSWIRDHRMEVILWDKDVRAIIDQPVMSYDCSSNSCIGTLNSSNFVVGYGCDSDTKGSVQLSTDNVYFDGQTLQEKINECIEKANKEKENNKMKFGNFDFGPVDSNIHMSAYGLAIKNSSGTWVSYDAANKCIMDVDILNFEGGNKFIYKIPAAIKDIAVGDTIVHNRRPMFVVAVRSDGKLACVDPYEGEEKVVMLAKSMFGFEFVTKVVCLITLQGASADQPFGNLLPLMLLSGDNKDIDPMMILALTGGMGNMAQNPLLLYALMDKNSNSKDILPLLLLGGGFAQAPSLQNGNSGPSANNS